MSANHDSLLSVKRTGVGLLAAVLLAAAMLRLYHLSAPSLWVDEIGQAVAGQKSLWGLLDLVRRHHGATPLDYLITGVMVRLTRADGVLRLPAAVWGILSVFWLFRLGRRWYSGGVGLIAAILLTVSAFHVRYAQELRFYSLAVWLTLLSTDALDYAWQSRRRRDWALYAVTAGLVLYASYYAALVLAFQTLWVGARWREERRAHPANARDWGALFPFLIAVAVAGLVFLPWGVYDIARERGLPAEGTPVWEWNLIESVATAWSGGSLTWWPAWVLLAFGGLAATWQRSRPLAMFLATWSFLLLPLVVTIDRVGSYFFHLRQTLIALPPFLLLVSAGAAWLVGWGGRLAARWWGERGGEITRRGLLLLLTLALVATSLPALLTYYHDQGRSEEWRNAAAILAHNAGAEDQVVLWLMDRYIGFYQPDLLRQVEKTDSLSDLERLYATQKPLWVLSTPYLGGRLDAGAIGHWLGTQPAILFDLGAGFKVYYLQAPRDAPGLWEQAQRFWLPADRPDIWWTAQARALSTVDAAESLSSFEKAAQLARGDAAKAERLGLAGDMAMQMQTYTRANDFYDQALALWPDMGDGELYLKKGLALLHLDRPHEALKSLTMAQEEYGRDDYWLHRWLGDAFGRLDRPGDAIPHLQRALILTPEAHDLRYLVGEAYARSGDNAQARIWLQNYLAHEPAGVWAAQAQALLASLPAP